MAAAAIHEAVYSSGTVLEGFEAAHADSPHATFLSYQDLELNRAEVGATSDAVAAAFAQAGLRRGDCVALLLQSMPQAVIALLAAWKLGARVTSLSPMLRRGELETVLADSRPAVIVALAELVGELPRPSPGGSSVRRVFVCSERDFGSSPRVSTPSPIGMPTSTFAQALTTTPVDLPAPPGPDDVALLSYTSGTTGRTKAALNTHANLRYSAEVYRDWAQLDSDDVIFAASPLFHITGLVAHVALPLITGAEVVLPHRFEAAAACRAIDRHGASFIVGPTTLYVALLEAMRSGRHSLRSIRNAYCGGAPVVPTVVERFEHETGTYLKAVYGLTETTGSTHCVPSDRRAPVDPDTGALSVGVAVAGTQAVIAADDGGNGTGEILVRGPGLAAGYWEQPTETAKAFRDGWLWTGDVGRIDSDGWLYVLDRRKDLIVTSGFNVWPREVEACLMQHPAVREAAVVGEQDAYRGESVAAFVTVRPGFAPEPEELIGFTRDRIAAYKCPRSVEIRAELPKTSSGKLQRARLRGSNR